MPKNKLSDLNDHLFLQLERLNDTDLKGEELAQEIERAKAIASIATPIVNNAKITVDAMKLVARGDIEKKMLGNILTIKDSDQS